MKTLYFFLPIVIVLELFLWNMPRQILYSDSSFIRGCALFGTTFVFIPAFMYLAFRQLKSKNWMMSKNWLMLVILSIPMNGMGAAIYINKVEVNDLVIISLSLTHLFR